MELFDQFSSVLWSQPDLIGLLWYRGFLFFVSWEFLHCVQAPFVSILPVLRLGLFRQLSLSNVRHSLFRPSGVFDVNPLVPLSHSCFSNSGQFSSLPTGWISSVLADPCLLPFTCSLFLVGCRKQYGVLFLLFRAFFFLPSACEVGTPFFCRACLSIDFFSPRKCVVSKSFASVDHQPFC